mmetsp:Transcript_106489/g.286498  ORF Transcript_106489/g.286498 Transcript_106489/m.286498 type:complete len:81 (-) Transcript_106489:224-466(-)
MRLRIPPLVQHEVAVLFAWAIMAPRTSIIVADTYGSEEGDRRACYVWSCEDDWRRRKRQLSKVLWHNLSKKRSPIQNSVF